MLLPTYLREILIVVAVFAVPVIVARSAMEITFDVDGKSSVQGCKEGDKTYWKFEPMPSNDTCNLCYCGHNYEKWCMDKRDNCVTELRCVDKEYDSASCCHKCPSGSNCWLDDRLISGCDKVEAKTSDPLCKRICECPHMKVYEEYGNETQANCLTMCF